MQAGRLNPGPGPHMRVRLEVGPDGPPFSGKMKGRCLVDMPKCIHLTKYFRSQKNVNIIHYNNYYSNTVCLRRRASGQGGGGGRPARNPGRPPTLPPYPAGLVIGVCGRKRPGRMVFLISQIHIDEIAAVANAVFYADPELQGELKEKRPYLFYEELENDFRELKAWTVTEHVGWFEKHGVKRLRKTKSYCYVLTPQWLEANLSYKTASTFCYIDESSEANSLLEKARAERFVPLFHWQSRNHIDVEPRVKALKTLNLLLRDLFYEVVEENNEKIVYDGVFGVEISAEMLGMRFRAFKKFCDSLSVEGGRTKRRGSIVVIEPYRRRVVRIRLSEDEYKALEECSALRGKTVREFFRGALLSSLLARRRM